MKYITKKAYIEGLAARGILRVAIMQKRAEPATSILENPPAGSTPEQPSADTSTNLPPGYTPIKDPVKKFLRIKSILESPYNEKGNYLAYGLGGAAISGALGAAIQAARKKQLLSGILAGAGIGGAVGAGGKYLWDTKVNPSLILKQMAIFNSPEFKEDLMKNYPDLVPQYLADTGQNPTPTPAQPPQS